MHIHFTLAFALMASMTLTVSARQRVPERPRILISTDIGGTDPDDNQSMMHFLLYASEFECEGLVSSPSFGTGDKSEILRMIDLYEADLPKLKRHARRYPTADRLRSVTKQGRRGAAPLCGYATPTEGSEWIVRCARRHATETETGKREAPLYVLVWGGLEDVAQALHDAPDIAQRIRVYWIGGPNKKWSVNAYVYIIENFPDLWMIENNASYRGFISDYKNPDRWNAGFYDHYAKGRGCLGKDFGRYLGGKPKLGDTPSLLYMMDGDPGVPERESWGGSFERYASTPRHIFSRTTTAQDTARVFSVIEWHVAGPVRNDITPGQPCITLHIDRQEWEGYYMGDGDYMVRYSTYRTGTLPYSITSEIAGFPVQNGQITISDTSPRTRQEADYAVGGHWYGDKWGAENRWNGHRGAMTVFRWREKAMEDWGRRCRWLGGR